ncbi:MAG TPA: hypothetical protein VI260_11380 [Blastocatellia bacterium]|jgi:hypothetical protein
MLNLKSIQDQRILAIVALLCPIVAAAVSWLLASSHTEFWNGVNKDLRDDANRHAGALMAIVEFTWIFFVMVLGFAAGLFFSVLSLILQRSLFGFFCLLANATPFLLFAAVRA